MTLDPGDYSPDVVALNPEWFGKRGPGNTAVRREDWPQTMEKRDHNIISIVLEGERPISWNKYWSGMHWSKRSAEKDRVKMLVRECLDPDTPMFSQPVEVRVRAFFKGNAQDCSNVCIKPYEDAIIGWLIKDDSPQYVTAVRVESRKDNERPRVEIDIVAV